MAFETAISGLNAATTQLDIASNNIANVNTNGFKQSRAEFSDIFTGSNLGVSSLAVSRGVRTAAINQQFDQGNIKSTNNNFDLAISGGGFFMLDDDGGTVYSRAGAFGVDRSGFRHQQRRPEADGLPGGLRRPAGRHAGAAADRHLRRGAAALAARSMSASTCAPRRRS